VTHPQPALWLHIAQQQVTEVTEGCLTTWWSLYVFVNDFFALRSVSQWE